MRRKQIWPHVLVTLAIAAFFACILLRLLAVTQETRTRSSLRRDLELYLMDQQFSGAVLISREDKILYSEGFGTAREEIVTEEATSEAAAKETVQAVDCTRDTVFPVFSLTKQFTAYTILSLEKEGKLSRDDLLSVYFPDCAYGTHVTIADLLSMTSGIPEYIGNEAVWGDAAETAYVEGIEPEKLLNAILSLPCSGQGTYQYSNSNYYLLGAIIEQVTGESYEAYLRENITYPAGMRRVSFDPQAAETRGFRGTGDKRESGREYHASVTFSAGALCTSITDLYQWQKFLYTDRAAADVTKQFSDDGYNCGLVRNGTRYSHSGDGIYHRAWMQYDTADGMQIIVLSNRADCEVGEIAAALYEMVTAYRD